MKTQHLLLLANRYAAHRGLTLSTVSTYAANDGKYFRKMAEGAGCTLRTAARLTTWFSENWPDDLVWPTDIPRPVDVTLTRTPEALSPHCLLETCASGKLAGGPTPPPVAPPAPFIHIPHSADEAPTSDADAGRAPTLTAPTHAPRGLPFPGFLRPYFRGWGDFIGDWIGVLSLFVALIVGLYIGAVFQ